MSVDSALLVPVDDQLHKHVGKKVRLAARLLGYDYSTGIALLANKSHGVLIDPSLCLDPFEKDHWARQLKMPIMVIGELEETATPMEVPKSHMHTEEPTIQPSLVLKAILLKPEPTLDLRLWDEAIYARQKFFQDKATSSQITSGKE